MQEVHTQDPWSGVSSNMLAFFARHVYIVCTMRVCRWCCDLNLCN